MAHWFCNARFLIVEDVMAVAESIALMLSDIGCEQVEMVGSVESALAELGAFQPDVVLLDIDLRAVSSAPVAQELHRLGVPFLFMTGYADPGMPPELAHVPVLEKPFSASSLQLALENLLGQGRES